MQCKSYAMKRTQKKTQKKTKKKNKQKTKQKKQTLFSVKFFQRICFSVQFWLNVFYNFVLSASIDTVVKFINVCVTFSDV